MERRKRVCYANPIFPLTALGTLATFVQYGISERANTTERGVPIIRMNNLQAHGWDLSDLKHIELDSVQLDRYRLMKGDLLFNRTNSKELVGKCEVFQEDGDWVFASYLIRVQVDTSRVIPEYVSAFLNSPAGRIQIDQVSRQIAGMSNVNAEELRLLEVPLPPLDFQRDLVAEIARARTERDSSLADAEGLLSGFETWALETMGLSIPQLSGRAVFAVKVGAAKTRLDPFHFSPEFMLIERALADFPSARLGELVRFSKEMWKPADAEDETFRYIEISSVDRRRGQAQYSELPVVAAPSRARMRVEPEDIIVSLTRPHHGSIALLTENHRGCIASTGFAVIRKVDSKRITRTFLWLALRFSISLKQMQRRSNGGNYPAITEDELANVVIPLPPLDIQEKIVDEVVRRNEMADRLEGHAKTVWREVREHFQNQVLKGNL